MGTAVKPYNAEESKKAQVTRMFDNISGNYDRLNRVMTGGTDQRWRRKAVKMLAPADPKIILDVATGTADFAILAGKHYPNAQVIGLDLSPQMLAVGHQKLDRLGLKPRVDLREADAENLPLPDNFADAFTVGFGVRNFENLPKGLAELHRVLRPGGIGVILEPSFPTRFPLKQVAGFYTAYVLPRLGRLMSRDRAAYDYLPASVAAFPHGPNFTQLCHAAGFAQATWHPLTFGICALYRLVK